MSSSMRCICPKQELNCLSCHHNKYPHRQTDRCEHKRWVGKDCPPCLTEDDIQFHIEMFRRDPTGGSV